MMITQTSKTPIDQAPRRCPFLRSVGRHGRDRCELAADHDGAHTAGGTSWSFTSGSSYEISPSHPSYYETIGTETVAIIRLSTDTGHCAYNLDDPTQATSLIQELRDLIDGSYMHDDVDPDTNDDKPWLTVAVVRKPKGWAAALPEFEGW